VSIKGPVPANARDKLGLAAGAPAVAADVLAARDRLLNAIRDDGYPMAKVDLPPVTLRPADNAVDVAFDAETGPYAGSSLHRARCEVQARWRRSHRQVPMPVALSASAATQLFKQEVANWFHLMLRTRRLWGVPTRQALADESPQRRMDHERQRPGDRRSRIHR